MTRVCEEVHRGFQRAVNMARELYDDWEQASTYWRLMSWSDLIWSKMLDGT